METPSLREDLISQLPALQLLQQLGYTYLSPAEADGLRQGKTSQPLLEEVLRRQLKVLNATRQVSATRTTYISDANIENGIRALKDLPLHEGYMAASQAAYDLLTLGKALEQNIDGDKRTFTLQYIDWKNPENNIFHITPEYSVMRSTSREHYRPDVVLFVNGIPLAIIECKRPDLKDPIREAISQHTRNQMDDGIRHLYVYSQLLLSVATLQARYGTTDTKEEFWATWREENAPDEKAALQALLHQPPAPAQLQQLLADRDRTEAAWIERTSHLPRTATPQDELLYALCRPERLLELVRDYIIFEGGKYKKIARYQQYFAIHKIINRILPLHQGRRAGGVVWHTQGSGKSLTMAMLARKIYQTVRNPKIIVVTDRVELDNQIYETFRKVQVPALKATTGSKLVQLLQSKSDAVVTTIINKFEAAVKQLVDTPLESPDIFVLIDEGHRTQYGTFNVKMQRVLPNACFLAFTGTPLMKKEKSTARKFGGIIDAYTIREAVEDKAIVPIVYEGRYAVQDVNQKALDRGFDSVAEPLSDYEKADLKKKYSRANLIGKTEQRIDEIARDISDHFYQNWGTDSTGDRSGFKGMVVTPDKAAAVRYKKAFDLIGKVTTEVIMSPPDDREGNEDAHDEPADEVVAFWKKMEAKHGRDFEKSLIHQFQKAADPELLIVVDKLLTGFDEPRVVVMYVCRKLKEHTLLQAIARVNRVAPGKDFGFVIDYEGIIGELDVAMNVYSNLAEFDQEDVQQLMTDLADEIVDLPQRHAALADIFKTVTHKQDLMAYTNLLADEALRHEFYQRYTDFARCLRMALASLQFERSTPEAAKERYRQDLKFYTDLRNAVVNTYSDKVDFKRYEKQLQKLLDQHVTTEEVIRLTEQVSILDTEAFEKELEKVLGARAKAETIASRTAKHITEHMDEDPVFYKRLSELIRQTISDLRAQRLSEIEAIRKLKAYRDQAITKQGDDVPPALAGHDQSVPFYRLLVSATSLSAEQGVAFALEVAAIVNRYKVVDWTQKLDVIRKINFYIGEYLIDEFGMPIEQAESIAEQAVAIAKVMFN